MTQLSPKPPLGIVVVEDNPADVFMIEEGLRETDVPFELIRYLDGGMALEAFQKVGANDPPYSLIILDLNVPRIDGFELLRYLRADQRFMNTPILILTSSSLDHDYRLAYQLGATRYMTKPRQMDEFLTAVPEVILSLSTR